MNTKDSSTVGEDQARLPSVDLLDDVAVWTPEIERLVQSTAEQIRLDQPGMIVSGPQRSGKSRACDYLAAVLPSVLGYPACTLKWTIPDDHVKAVRLFIQERMLQSGCNAISHRDLAVLRGRLLDHTAELAAALGARRLVVIIDEAQCLNRDEYGLLVYLFNEMERRRLRPFILLVGEPQLKQVPQHWITADAQQMIGRFSTRTHEYLGIRLDDLGQVLDGFDDESDGPEATAAFRTSPQAYADGWRVAMLAPLMSDAIRRVAAAQNVQEEVHLPMQYLRSCLLSMLYRIIQKSYSPEALPLAEAIDCVKASNFARVLQYYVRKSTGDELRGTPTPGIRAGALQ